MNPASPYPSAPTWPQRLRQPLFLAIALSLGLHGVLFAAVPLLARGNDKPGEPESVAVVELSPEEAAQLPVFTQDGALNPNNFGNPLVSQTGVGVGAVPVPGEPPLGDLTTDFNFSNPTSPGIFGPPLDLLPPVPVDSGVQPFDSSLFVTETPPQKSPPPSVVIPQPTPKLLPPPAKFNDPQLEEPKVNLDPMSPLTPIENETPRPANDPKPGTAPTETPVAQANPGQPQTPPASEQPAPQPTQQPAPTAEQIIALQRQEQAARLQKYAADGTGAEPDPEDMSNRQADFVKDLPAGFKLAPRKDWMALTLDLPEDFPQCDRELHDGLFMALVPAEGGTPSKVDVQDSTGVDALNQQAIAAIQSQSFPVLEKGVSTLHYVTVSFKESGETCTKP